MSIDQTNTIDFATIDKASGDLWLTISDHLPWDDDEGSHLLFLQDKLNSYLRFIESGEVFQSIPEAKGRDILINLVGKFPMSDQAKSFLAMAQKAIQGAGFQLQFTLSPPN